MPHYQAAEKRINDIFFKETFDGRSKLDITRVVGAKMVADEKAKDPAYYGQQKGVVHVSNLYACQRGLLLSMLGFKAPEKSDAEKQTEERKLGVFKAGNLFEDFIVDALGDRIIERQREYRLEYKGIVLVGRSDGLMRDDFSMNPDDNFIRVLEAKSVNSNAFWYRKQEGTLIQWHNQIQLQTYLWLERKLFGNQYEGFQSYISKDDCTVDGCAVKFNQRIIDEIVVPTLDALAAAYAAYKDVVLDPNGEEFKKALESLPAPPLAVFNSTKQQYEQNWLAKYCDYHSVCAGQSWPLIAADEVKRLNKEFKSKSIGMKVG